jgi:hypothetical protein
MVVLDKDGTIEGCCGLEVMQMRTTTHCGDAFWYGV